MTPEQIDLVFKALAHQERRRILASLHHQPGQSLFEICASTVGADGQALTRQTISQHLQALERAGLVSTSWSGRTKAHFANLGPLRDAVDAAMSPFPRPP